MTKQEQSEKIIYGSLITSTKCYNCIHFPLCFAQKSGVNLGLASENDCCYYQSKLPEDSVVLSREEYEKLRSLYDCEQGSYMTSSIGDLPLTVEGLRKAVDEITRLNRVESELQELNAKYYNEAKDSRRELKQARKETAEKILDLLVPDCKTCDENWHRGCLCLRATLAEKIVKQFGVE